MPWLETDVREQRMQFIVEATRPSANVSAVCRAYGISRTTGYRWLGRYQAVQSLTGLAERSRRPHAESAPGPRRARRTRIEALRREYGWAGRKLQVLLAAGRTDRVRRRRLIG